MQYYKAGYSESEYQEGDVSDQSTLLLVHGAWMGPWQWDFLAPELERRGISFTRATLPSCGPNSETLGSLADDAAAIEAAAQAAGDDVIVVAHSYAGVPTTQATLGPNVRHIVYLGAFMPDAGRSLVSYFPPNVLPPFVHLRDDGATDLVNELIPVHLCNECADERTDWLIERVVLQAASVVMTPVDRASWHACPSTYLVLANDQAIPTELQRMYAPQATRSVELASDHMPMLSHPAALADALAEIVTTTRSSAGATATPAS
jgi:pimeloyl-ACP methyl ester carboxylesterase